MIDLDKARHLVALADHGTFNKAAVAVHLTQPAFSRSIRALERELDVQLVDRGARQSRLTPYGELVVDRARHLLRGVRDTHRVLAELRDGAAGTLAVGLGPATAALVTGPFLAELARELPSLRVRLETGPVAHLLELLREERIDAVIGAYRPFAVDPDFEATVIAAPRAGFFVRPGHPLLAEPATGVAALAPYTVMATSLPPHAAHLFTEALGPAGHPDRLATVRCDDVRAMSEVASGTDAVLLALDVTVRDRVAAGTLVPLRVPGVDAIDFRIAVSRLRDRTLPPAMARFEAIARRCLAA